MIAPFNFGNKPVLSKTMPVGGVKKDTKHFDGSLVAVAILPVILQLLPGGSLKVASTKSSFVVTDKLGETFKSGKLTTFTINDDELVTRPESLSAVILRV